MKKKTVQEIICFMNTTGRKAEQEKDSRLISSSIALSTTGSSAEVSWDVMEAAGQGSPPHGECQERKGLL